MDRDDRMDVDELQVEDDDDDGMEVELPDLLPEDVEDEMEEDSDDEALEIEDDSGEDEAVEVEDVEDDFVEFMQEELMAEMNRDEMDIAIADFRRKRDKELAEELADAEIERLARARYNERQLEEAQVAQQNQDQVRQLFRERDDADRLLQRAEVLEKRLQRFHDSAQYSKLHLTDCNWHHLVTLTQFPQVEKLCGYSYGYRVPSSEDMHDLYHHNIDAYTANEFLEITAKIMYSFGAMPVYNDELTKWMFERTMKLLVQYLNIMYDSARSRGRTHISSLEVHELIWSNKTFVRNYLRHFYPIIHLPDSNIRFRNKHSSRIHFTYHHSRETVNIYHSEALETLELMKTMRFVRLKNTFEPGVVIHGFDGRFHTTFCSPSGTGVLSAFAANRFHEALGMPPLEPELISVIDFMAKQIMGEITYRTICWMDTVNIHCLPYLHCYQSTCHMSADDVLFSHDIQIVDSTLPNPAFQIRGRQNVDVQSYYENNRMFLALDEYRADFYQRHFPERAQESDYLTVRDQLEVNCSRRR